jgi:osmotically-inducible protein OsmY
VRSDKLIKRVYDEIQVISGADHARRREALKNKAPPEPKNKNPIDSDYWVETKISAQLLASADVSLVNYR